MFYRMNVAGLERDLPICRVNDQLYIAGFVIFGDPELTVACARELLAKAPEYDYIITAEAKGIPLAHEMARQAGDSLNALEALVEKAGGIICGRMAILAEGDAQDRQDLIYLEKLPLFHPDGTVME